MLNSHSSRTPFYDYTPCPGFCTLSLTRNPRLRPHYGGQCWAAAAIGRTGGEPRPALAGAAHTLPPTAWRGAGAGAGLSARAAGGL